MVHLMINGRPDTYDEQPWKRLSVKGLVGQFLYQLEVLL
jgi:hypothetical protein